MLTDTDEQILRKIETLQEVQRNSPPTSREWIEASKILHPLFAEMARRTAPPRSSPAGEMSVFPALRPSSGGA